MGTEMSFDVDFGIDSSDPKISNVYPFYLYLVRKPSN